MSPSPSKTMVPAISSLGESIRISLKSAKRYEQRGRGHFEGETFMFARDDYRGESAEASMCGGPAPLAGRQSPRMAVSACDGVDHFGGCDSGFGFLRYPMECGVSSGPKYPALARMGAGL